MSHDSPHRFLQRIAGRGFIAAREDDKIAKQPSEVGRMKFPVRRLLPCDKPPRESANVPAKSERGTILGFLRQAGAIMAG